MKWKKLSFSMDRAKKRKTTRIRQMIWTHVSEVVHCFFLHKLNKFKKSTLSTTFTRKPINDPFGRVNKFFIKFLTFYPFLLLILFEVEHDAFFSLLCSFYSFYSNILSFMENFLFVRSHSSFCSHSIT